MSENLNRVKLSQWDALILESLRTLGWSDDELLRRVASGELPVDESEFHFDYKQLAVLQAEQPELFERAVREGYQIKYNTIRGVRSWIFVALGKEPVLELEPGKEAVEVSLTAAEKARLEGVLSFGWEIHEGTGASDAETSSYRIEPVQR
ncbi:hypothetical protein A8L34_18980 [Bacillus sp. FJAT-27264]|uniref:hypothetical protein n=1 Tax=Paenibacillus sp. (strain DSM 101736 / FJAT-27264) TaxID=1850362 RepID=UPI000807F584|nr:hypothetical protein [Bacillus sp. FJAT-27264]OBZ10664.1 hypothetical protein A8L34_18980 [Bacillus sp. FJAT-27264]